MTADPKSVRTGPVASMERAAAISTSRPDWIWHLALALACLLPCFDLEGQAAGEGGQRGSRWFPNVEPFVPLLAPIRETQLRTSLVAVERPDSGSFDGRNLEAEVVFGWRIPILLLAGGATSERALTLSFEAGAFSRFSMERERYDFISVDYRVLIPLNLRSGPWSARVGWRHVSSHLGDDYINRFGTEVTKWANDGIEATVAWSTGAGALVYAGGDYNVHDVERIPERTIRWGAEWDSARSTPEWRVRPFLAGNFERSDAVDEWGGTLVGGGRLTHRWAAISRRASRSLRP